MPFQSCRLLFPLLWDLAKHTPDGRLTYLRSGWSRLVGSPLSAKTEPTALRDDTLVITVSSAVWQKALEKMTAVLIRRINESCGGMGVRQVEFRVGRITPWIHQAIEKPKTTQDTLPAAPPLSVEGLGREIKDPVLRESFAAAAVKNLMLRRHY